MFGFVWTVVMGTPTLLPRGCFCVGLGIKMKILFYLPSHRFGLEAIFVVVDLLPGPRPPPPPPHRARGRPTWGVAACSLFCSAGEMNQKVNCDS